MICKTNMYGLPAELVVYDSANGINELGNTVSDAWVADLSNILMQPDYISLSGNGGSSRYPYTVKTFDLTGISSIKITAKIFGSVAYGNINVRNSSGSRLATQSLTLNNNEYEEYTLDVSLLEGAHSISIGTAGSASAPIYISKIGLE